MHSSEIDLLSVNRGSVSAPAGCGKTQLIANNLLRHASAKPVLVLTHTNAGVAALRARLDKAGVAARSCRLSTIDGWAMRLISTFPDRSLCDVEMLKLQNPRNDYPGIRLAAWRLLESGNVKDVLRASYERLIVDEYQDCSLPQHAIICHAATALSTCVLGDPMQAIFGWQGNELAKWDQDVCTNFPVVGELSTPWRWRNAGTEPFGQWLLDVRQKLKDSEHIDLRSAPPEVAWIHLDGSEDRARQLKAAQTKAPTVGGSVLIIGDSRSPQSQQLFASQTPGAVTVEAVDLRDLVAFARSLNFQAPDALATAVQFAGSVMTNVGSADLLRRVEILERGSARRKASAVESAAIRFNARRTPDALAELFDEIRQDGGVREYRPAVIRACFKALQSCDLTAENSFYENSIRARESNRLLGRSLPRRAVGSTLLLKGLEADVSVILDASELDARNLYVAMTRGCRKLVVCSKTPILNG